MATIGQKLNSPETTWRRYDEDFNLLIYTGSWNDRVGMSGSYGAYWRTTLYQDGGANGSFLKFKFYGTKFRLIGAKWWSASTSIDVYIDDVLVENISQNSGVAQNVADITCVLSYEKLNLPLGVHTVKMVNRTTNYLIADAIDIDDIGYIIPYSFNGGIKTNLSSMKIGDMIPCRYTAPTSGQFGVFSELGTTTATPIPVASSATPDGSFNWIHSGFDTKGRMKLLADRNIQHSISWDILNSNGVASGSGITPTILTTTDLVKTATLTCDSTFTGYNLENIRDGSYSTSWYSNKTQTTTGAYIGVDLGTPSKFGAIMISVKTGCTSFDLQYSDDNVNYITAKTYTCILNVDKQLLNVIDYGNHRYWKLNNIITTYSSASIGISELCFIKTFNELNSDSKLSLRLLTGGTSTTDTDNEWDKIIVLSTLGGNITAGDNNVWNTNSIASWTSTTGTANTNRVIRGNATVSTYLGTTTSSTANTTTGFRPMLLVDLPITKYLVQDGTSLKTISGSTLSQVANTTDSDTVKVNAFLNSGMDDFSTWSTNLLSQISNNTFSVLMYKESVS